MTVFNIGIDVAAQDLSALYPYAKYHEFFPFFMKGPGQEHYSLLAHLSKQCSPGSTVLDIGTFTGFSALALAANPDIKVITYDLVDNIPNDGTPTIRQVPNIDYRIQNCLEDIETMLKAPLISLDVDPHDGMQEVEIITSLIRAGYKGIVVCDDIYKNDGMKAFWNWVPLKKVDVSRYGHWSGTGIVVFDPSVHDIVVQ